MLQDRASLIAQRRKVREKEAAGQIDRERETDTERQKEDIERTPGLSSLFSITCGCLRSCQRLVCWFDIPPSMVLFWRVRKGQTEEPECKLGEG